MDLPQLYHLILDDEAGQAPASDFLLGTWLDKLSIQCDGIVTDELNLGVSRSIIGGKALSFDGVNGIITYGNVGSLIAISMRVKLNTDDQVILTLQNSVATTISVVAGVLTFGASLTESNIRVDDVSKTAAQAGVILNDNFFHLLTFDLVSISGSNLIIGTDSAAFGDFDLFDLRIFNTALTAAEITNLFVDPSKSATSKETGWWRLDDHVFGDTPTISLDTTSNNNHGDITGGVTVVTQDVVSWQDKLGHNEGFTPTATAKVNFPVSGFTEIEFTVKKGDADAVAK